MEISFPSSKMKPQAVALLATLGVFAFIVGSVFFAGRSVAATKSIAGRGIVREPNAAANTLRIDFLLTVPTDETLNGATADLKLSGTTQVLQNVGQTAIGAVLQPIKTKRVRIANVERAAEVTFKGTYTKGDKDSVRVSEIRVTDRSFSVCGKLQGITRRSATGTSSNSLTVEMTKATVQEARYGRFFVKGKDSLFTFVDGTQFHNAAGTLAKPHGRVSIQAADVTASQQTIGLHGKVLDGSTLEVKTVDLGVKCS